VAAAARDLRIDGTVLVTVAAERLMSESNEMKLIASDPRSRNMFLTPTLSTIMNASSGVLSAICDGITLHYYSISLAQMRLICTGCENGRVGVWVILSNAFSSNNILGNTINLKLKLCL